MFVGVNGVKAESVSIDDLISNFDKTELVKAYNQIGSSISLTKDESNNKLNVIFDEEVSGSYSYTDEYVEYDNRDVEVTEENCMGNLSDILYMVSIMESIFISSGYEGKTISDDMPVDISYDEYGIVIETEPYSFESTDEDGGAVSSSGNYVKYMKISLDKTKIDKLMADYGENTDDGSQGLVDIIPSIKYSDITSNSISFTTLVDGYTGDDALYCMVFRSDSIDGEYVPLSDVYVSCNGDDKIIDSDLKSNTTYFYKTKVLGGIDFSDAVSVKTLAAAKKTTNTTSKEKIDNPKTGNLGLMMVMFIMSLSMFGILCNRIKNNNMG